jgi:hypothetical protein
MHGDTSNAFLIDRMCSLSHSIDRMCSLTFSMDRIDKMCSL